MHAAGRLRDEDEGQGGRGGTERRLLQKIGGWVDLKAEVTFKVDDC